MRPCATCGLGWSAGLGDLGPPVGAELVQRVVDDLPHMAVGVGKEPIGPTDGCGSGLLDHDPAGSGRLLERGIDLVVSGHVNGQDGLAGRLARQRGGDLLATELGEQLIGADQEKVEVFGSDSPINRHFTTGPVAGFLVDDIQDATAELRSAGVEILYESGVDDSGNAWVHFRAPDSNIYEFTQDPGVSRPR